MENRWSDEAAAAFAASLASSCDRDLAACIYASRLIGSEAALVLHGGGNTSVKTTWTDGLGEKCEALFVKASGRDLATIDLETALRLLSLPRVVGVAEDGEEITAQNGRYGPYLKKGTDSRSLTSEQQLFDITLDEALAVYAQPKQRGRAAAKPPLAELGTDPVSGRPVVVKDGRFGPYVTDGETNATLRKDDDPEKLSPERGYELLAEKRAKGPAKKTARKRTTTKAAATKSTARKRTAKKS